MTKRDKPAAKPRGDDSRTQDQHAADDREEVKKRRAKMASDRERSPKKIRPAANIIAGPGSDERRARAQADEAQRKRFKDNASSVRTESGDAAKLAEPRGMEDVPKSASRLFRDKYASVLRDYHAGRPLFPTKRIAANLKEAKAVATKFAEG